MKRISIVFLLLLLLGLVGCGGTTEVISQNEEDIVQPKTQYGTDTDEEIAVQYFNALAKSDYDLLLHCFPKDETLDVSYDSYKEIADTGYFYTYDFTKIKITIYNISSDENKIKLTCPCEEGHPGSMYKSTAELNIIVYTKDGKYYIDQTQSDKYIKTTNLIPMPD